MGQVLGPEEEQTRKISKGKSRQMANKQKAKIRNCLGTRQLRLVRRDGGQGVNAIHWQQRAANTAGRITGRRTRGQYVLICCVMSGSYVMRNTIIIL